MLMAERYISSSTVMTKGAAVNTCTIVVLIALAEEHEHFLKVFPYKGDLSENSQICLEHDQPNKRVRLISVLANQMGAQSASESAEFAISKLVPDMIVIVGIAGAVSGDVAIGDVCVSNEVIDVLHNNKVTDKRGKSDIAFAPDFYSIDADLVSCFTFLRAHPKLKEFMSDGEALRTFVRGMTQRLKASSSPVPNLKSALSRAVQSPRVRFSTMN